ncbi:MAG: hypothetical protein ACI8WB_001730 [Phenylobacterium sp.]|jgi:hypothetical protein
MIFFIANRIATRMASSIVNCTFKGIVENSRGI